MRQKRDVHDSNLEKNAIDTIGSVDKTEIQKINYSTSVKFCEFDHCSVII
jgi:hypothetical protein